MRPVRSQTALGWALVLALATCASFSHAQTRKNRPTMFMPLNRSGGDLCDFTPDSTFFTGSWWCFEGKDGSTKSGSAFSFSPVNAPTTANSDLYPSGLDRGTTTGTLFNGTSQYEQSPASAGRPAGDFSVCAVARRDNTTANRDLVSSDDATARGFLLRSEESANEFSFYLFKSNATNTNINTGTGKVATKGYHLICATYDFVADGTSVMTLYIDGTATGTPSTTAVGPVQAEAAARWYIATNGNNPGSNIYDFGGLVLSAFMTEKVLTAAQIAQLDRHVHGGRGFLTSLDINQRQTGYETAIACSRSSLARWISNGFVQTVAANTPRIGPEGFYSDGAATNICLQSESFDNATWTKDANTTATADAVVAPDGQTTADRLNENSVANAVYRFHQTISTAANTTYVYSVFAKSASAATIQFAILDCQSNVSGDHFFGFNVGTGQSAGSGGGSTTALATQALANGWYRVAIRFATNGTDSSADCGVGFSTANGDYTHVGVNGAAGYFWGAQLEAVTDGTTPVAPTAYITTTTTSVARSADSCDWTPPSGVFSTSTGCFRFCTTAFGASESRAIALNGGSVRLGYITGNSYAAYDGVQIVSLAANESAGGTKCFRTTWSSTTGHVKVENLTDGTSNDLNTSFAGFSSLSTLRFGHNTTISERPSLFFGVLIGPTTSDCQ